MKKVDEDLLNQMIKYEKMLADLEDNAAAFPEFRSFFRLLLRTKHPTLSLPVIELISLLKKKKPTVFYYLRQEAKKDFMLSILTGNLMSAEQAEKRFHEFKERLKS
ncbi:hypothetical protein ACM26V_07285 [Salipaludibacillus sp. HK11]|uniref:hypothetical protein n=1 Tax=Salipaludibacillus sp. HK11 TaxID=3394320 RepID=UPI0039FD347C